MEETVLSEYENKIDPDTHLPILCVYPTGHIWNSYDPDECAKAINQDLLNLSRKISLPINSVAFGEHLVDYVARSRPGRDTEEEERLGKINRLFQHNGKQRIYDQYLTLFALHQFKQAVSRGELQPDALPIGEALYLRAKCLFDHGNLFGVEPMIQALPILEKHLGPDHPHVNDARGFIGNINGNPSPDTAVGTRFKWIDTLTAAKDAYQAKVGSLRRLLKQQTGPSEKSDLGKSLCDTLTSLAQRYKQLGQNQEASEAEAEARALSDASGEEWLRKV